MATTIAIKTRHPGIALPPGGFTLLRPGRSFITVLANLLTSL